jgi:single-strand DNA-binding protein
MSVNKVVLIGHLGADPVFRTTESGKSVVNFRLATNSVWEDDDGATHKATAWHNIVAWGQTAKFCASALTKGSQVYIEGAIRTRSYEREYEYEVSKKKKITFPVKQYVTEVIARTVLIVGVTVNGKESFYDDARK